MIPKTTTTMSIAFLTVYFFGLVRSCTITYKPKKTESSQDHKTSLKSHKTKKQYFFDPFHWHLGMITVTFFFANETNKTKKLESPKVFCHLADELAHGPRLRLALAPLPGHVPGLGYSAAECGLVEGELVVWGRRIPRGH
jgi:hypothetical protein